MEWGIGIGEYFEEKRELRKRCVMLPCLFNVIIGRVVRQAKEKARVKGMKWGWEWKKLGRRCADGRIKRRFPAYCK